MLILAVFLKRFMWPMLLFFSLIEITSCFPLPVFPNQFTAVVEANIVNKNYTIHMHEWYDLLNERGRVDWYSNRKHASSTSIYDFINDRYYHTNKSGCYWGDIKHIGKSAFMTMQSGTPHLTSSAALMQFGGNISEIYIGQESARGILCNKWRADRSCLGRGDMKCDYNFTLDYFFSLPSWSSPEVNGTQIPIRAVLEGSRRARFDYKSMQPIIPPTIIKFYHIYDFTSFHIGPPAPTVFERPCGVECSSTNETWNPSKLPAIECPAICSNDDSSQENPSSSAPPLPSLPNLFSAIIEANIVNKNYTVHMHEWYDEQNQRGRTDWYSNREGGFTSSIYDFKNDRYYHTNKSGCFWGDTKHIGRLRFMAANSGTPHLTSTTDLFRFGGNIKEIYMGQESARGILCDKWRHNFICGGRSGSCDSNFTLDYFFAVSSWSTPQANSSRIPIRAVLKGIRRIRFDRRTRQPISPPTISTFYHIYDYTSFHVGPLDASDFKRPCDKVCESTNKTWNSTQLPAAICLSIGLNNYNTVGILRGMEDGSVAALTILLFILGIIIGCLLDRRCARKNDAGMSEMDDLSFNPETIAA